MTDGTTVNGKRTSDAEAIAFEATLEAVGAGRPQNWTKALALLRSAAEQGSSSARSQLHVLQLDGDAGAGEVQALLAHPPVVRLSEEPRIRSIGGFASPGECAWLKQRGKLTAARVFDPATGQPTTDPRRNNSTAELELQDLDVVTQVIRARIAAATQLPLPVFEPPQVMRYSPGEEFRPHYDWLDTGTAEAGQAGQRIATFLIYLNEDFEDGETDFPRVGLRHRGRTGDAMFFANIDRAGAVDPLTLHAGRPPRGGDKWIFSQWIRDRSPSISPGP